MTCFLEDFWSHVAGSSACCGQDVELFFVHDSRKAKVSDEEVGIVFWGSEEEVFGFEVTVHYTVVVEVSDCGESCTDEVCGVRFIV